MNISELIPNPKNPRFIKDDKFKLLCQSIKRDPEIMALRPIIYDDTKLNTILGGNQRFYALKELGFTEIPDSWVKPASGLTEAQKRRFIVLDNAPFGEWDWELISIEFEIDELYELGVDVPDSLKNSGDAVEDDYVIPDEIETDIANGDIFEIEQHRLLCGDSTKWEDVKKCLAGGNPILMITDPPYGVNYDPTWRHKAGVNHSTRQGLISNDNRIDWTETYSLFKGDIMYVWHGGRNGAEVAKNISHAGFEIVSQIIWNKQQMVLGRSDYHWKHEPCWYAVRKGAKHRWNGGRKQTTVWDINNLLSAKDEDSKQFHGTQKPVECMARPIRNNTYEMESVYDPFIGSGTTMVAAHQLNRKCYGIEIDPKYCQIIIDRMAKFDHTLRIFKNGKPYAINSEQTA